MVMGEHAVLHGHLALVCAVDQTMHVNLTPIDEPVVRIDSALGTIEQPLSDITPASPFTFILRAVQHHLDQLPTGCLFTVRSAFSDQVGLGSSAAVTAATHALIGRWLGRPLDLMSLFESTMHTIHHVQGRGSGADAAASIFGGMVAYRAQPRTIERLPSIPDISVVYSGSKTPTVEVIRRITEQQKRAPETYATHYQALGALSEQGRTAAEAGQWAKLGTLLNAQQTHFEAMELCTPELSEIITALRAQPTILGAKISGAGLGDCAIGLGTFTPPPNFRYDVFPLSISTEGIVVKP